MENPKSGIALKYKVFAGLFIATFLGWAVPHILYRLLQPQIIRLTFTVNQAGMWGVVGLGLLTFLLSGGLTGLWVSLAQWIAMRKYMRFGLLWIIALVLVWVLGEVLGYAIIIYHSLTSPYSQFDANFTSQTLSRYAIVGLFTGFFVGILQQFFLQKRTGIKIWWALAGWAGVFAGIFLLGGNASASSYYVTIDPIYASILSGAAFAGIAALPALLMKGPAAQPARSTPGDEQALPASADPLHSRGAT